MFYAYVLISLINGSFYYGSSKYPEKRLAERHNKGCVPSTSRYRPWKLAHKEAFKARSEAVKREKFFKSGQGRNYIHNLYNEIK